MRRVPVHITKKTAVRINKVVVPHNCGAFLGWYDQVGRVTVDAKVELVCVHFGIF